MSLYSNNLEALKKRDRDLAEKVGQVPILNYRAEKTDGEWNILDINTQKYLYPSKKIDKNISYDFKKKNIGAAKLAVFLGFGLSKEYNIFISEYAKKRKTELLLVIEESLELFRLCLETLDLTKFLGNPRIKLIVGEEPNKAYPEIHQWILDQKGYYFSKALSFIYWEGYIAQSPEYYRKMTALVRDAMKNAVLKFGDSAEDSIIGERHMFRNLEHIIKNPGINMLYNKFKNKPAVVISTGPSLNKNKHLLKSIEGKAMFFCPEASLRILSEMGIKPHFVTSLERDEFTTPLVSGYPEGYLEDVYLTAPPVIVKETYDAYRGPKVMVYRTFDHFKWLELDKGMLDIKLSAGNMAFKIAEALGCSPIILIGQDLAFSREGKTHAKGMELGEDQSGTASDYKQVRYVKANYGEDIRTTEIWYQFLRGYEMDLKKYSGICINATEGGAYVEGTEVMTFQEAIDTYIPQNAGKEEFAQQIKAVLKSFTVKNIEKDYKHILKKLKIALKDMQKMIQIYEEILSRIDQKREFIQNVLQGSEEKRDRMAVKEVYSFYNERETFVIKSYYETLQLLIMHIVQSKYIQFQNNICYIDSMIEEEVLKKANLLVETYSYYGDCIGIIKIVKKMIEEEKELLEREEYSFVEGCGKNENHCNN